MEVPKDTETPPTDGERQSRLDSERQELAVPQLADDGGAHPDDADSDDTDADGRQSGHLESITLLARHAHPRPARAVPSGHACRGDTV